MTTDRNDRVRGALMHVDRMENEMNEIRTELEAALTETTDPREIIEQAITGECAIAFNYTKKAAELSARVVSPYELESYPDHDTVLGFDHSKDELRQFRLDRIAGGVQLSPDRYIPAST